MQSQSREPGGTSPPRIRGSNPPERLPESFEVMYRTWAIGLQRNWRPQTLCDKRDMTYRVERNFCGFYQFLRFFQRSAKNTFSQINITADIFPTKICSRVNILLLKFATQKRSTKKSCLFIHNLSASFRNETVYYELLVLCRVRTP